MFLVLSSPLSSLFHTNLDLIVQLLMEKKIRRESAKDEMASGDESVITEAHRTCQRFPVVAEFRAGNLHGHLIYGRLEEIW